MAKVSLHNQLKKTTIDAFPNVITVQIVKVSIESVDLNH